MRLNRLDWLIIIESEDLPIRLPPNLRFEFGKVWDVDEVGVGSSPDRRCWVVYRNEILLRLLLQHLVQVVDLLEQELHQNIDLRQHLRMRVPVGLLELLLHQDGFRLDLLRAQRRNLEGLQVLVHLGLQRIVFIGEYFVRLEDGAVLDLLLLQQVFHERYLVDIVRLALVA